MSDTPHAYPLRRPVKSRLVGPARQADGTTTTAYRAVQPHMCGQCGAEIAPDALFSRRTVQMTRVSAIGLMQTPVCITCRPLQVEADGA